MKQNKIMEAYHATESMADNNNISHEDQWKIYQARKAMRPHIEFYEERTKAIQSKYVEYADENGTISGEPFRNYQKDIAELLDMEKDMEDYKVPTVKLVDGINFKTIEALEGLIEFEPAE